MRVNNPSMLNVKTKKDNWRILLIKMIFNTFAAIGSKADALETFPTSTVESAEYVWAVGVTGAGMISGFAVFTHLINMLYQIMSNNINK